MPKEDKIEDVEEQIDPQKEREELGKEKPKSKDTARLVWASKPKKEPTAKDLDFQTAEEVYPNKEYINNKDKKLNTFWAETKDVSDDPNRVIWGDNLLVMKALLAKGYEGQIDLIYIDPPFNTGENFNFVNEVQIGDKKFDKELTMSERLAYTDTWKRGVDSFLDMLYPRLQLMRRLLSEKGLLFIHLDVNASHYVKIILDEIFGRDNFVNEIIWRRTNNPKGSQYQSKKLGEMTDNIFIYSKNINYTFNLQKIKKPLSQKDLEKKYPYSDEKGRYYSGPIVRSKSMGARPNLVYEYKGYTPGYWGWRLKKEELIKLDKKGDLGWSSTGNPFRKLRPENDEGNPIFNLWDDINRLYAGKEFLDYPTQKPVALLRRILELGSNKEDLIADFFCGSGTTASVAEKLGRNWITSDLSKTSIQVIRSRLVNQGANPFLVQNLGNYQRQLIYANKVNLKEMYNIILKLYGANPRKDRQAFGISKSNKNNLVYVCEPDRPMMAGKALELAKEAKNMDGKGYKKLVILAWDYEMGFDQDWKRIATRKKDMSDIEFKIIPSDVYKYLRSTKVGDPEISDKIVFYQKPYLKLEAPKKVSDSKESARVKIKLDRYVVPDIPVRDEKKRPEIDKLLRKNFAHLIDYWTIDWDYDGEVFRSNWQAIKERKSSKPVPTTAETTLKKGKKYKIAVRVVDVFGNDAFGVQEINLK